MKKTLIAVAALAATSAFAQVTVYGRMDVGYGSYTSEAGTTETKTTGVMSKNSASSLWGIKGSEDLGGGLKAMFQLEGNIDPATGNGVASSSKFTYDTVAPEDSTVSTTNTIFDRVSLVGLSGAFGTVSLGRDYTPMFKLIAASEINGFSNLTTLNLNDPDGNGTTSPEQIIYNSPNMSGFQFNASVGNNKKEASDAKLSHTNLTVTYNNGPLMVGAGVGSTTKTTISTNADAETDGMALVAGYNFGTFALKGNYINREITEGGVTEEDTEYNIGATMPMGKVTLSAQVGRNKYEEPGFSDSGTDVVLGAEYALSAKTALYAKTGTVNKWSDSKEKTTGTAVGIRTVF